jgi:hypothetical protein
VPCSAEQSFFFIQKGSFYFHLTWSRTWNFRVVARGFYFVPITLFELPETLPLELLVKERYAPEIVFPALIFQINGEKVVYPSFPDAYPGIYRLPGFKRARLKNSDERIYCPRTFQQIFAIRAKPALFPVEVVQRQGIMHDTFRNHAVIKPEKMSNLMGTLFYRPVDQIILVSFSAVKFIGESGSRHNRSTGGRAGKAE